MNRRGFFGALLAAPIAAIAAVAILESAPVSSAAAAPGLPWVMEQPTFREVELVYHQVKLHARVIGMGAHCLEVRAKGMLEQAA